MGGWQNGGWDVFSFALNPAPTIGFTDVRTAYGAKGDGLTNYGSITNGQTAVHSDGLPAFSSGDVGKLISIRGAGAAGAIYYGTIATYVGPSDVTVTPAASTTATSQIITWGTDDTVAIQAAFTDYANWMKLLFPRSLFLVTNTINIPNAMNERLIEGENKSMGPLQSPTAGTCIQMQGDNKPVFKTVGSNLPTGFQGVQWRNLTVSYAARQDSTRTNSYGFQFHADTASGGGTWYWWEFEHVDIWNAYIGYGYDASQTGGFTLWGAQWRDIGFFNLQKNAFAFSSPTPMGVPSNKIDGMRVINTNSDSGVSSGFVFDCNGVEWTIDQLDIEGWYNGIAQFLQTQPVHIRGLHVEHHNFTADNVYLFITSGQLTVEDFILMGTSTAGVTGQDVWIFRALSNSQVTIRKMESNLVLNAAGRIALINAQDATSEVIRLEGFRELSGVGHQLQVPDFNYITTTSQVFSYIGSTPNNVVTAQTAAVASITAVTAPNDGFKHLYRVSGFVTITTLGSGVINLEVSYTDSNGVAHTTCIIPLCAQAGAFAAAANTADSWKGSVLIDVNPNTAITVLTAGTFTGCTYNTGATIERVR